jgi:hypothetical protein
VGLREALLYCYGLIPGGFGWGRWKWGVAVWVVPANSRFLALLGMTKTSLWNEKTLRGMTRFLWNE